MTSLTATDFDNAGNLIQDIRILDVRTIDKKTVRIYFKKPVSKACVEQIRQTLINIGLVNGVYTKGLILNNVDLGENLQAVQQSMPFPYCCRWVVLSHLFRKRDDFTLTKWRNHITFFGPYKKIVKTPKEKDRHTYRFLGNRLSFTGDKEIADALQNSLVHWKLSNARIRPGRRLSAYPFPGSHSVSVARKKVLFRLDQDDGYKFCLEQARHCHYDVFEGVSQILDDIIGQLPVRTGEPPRKKVCVASVSTASFTTAYSKNSEVLTPRESLEDKNIRVPGSSIIHRRPSKRKVPAWIMRKIDDISLADLPPAQHPISLNVAFHITKTVLRFPRIARDADGEKRVIQKLYMDYGENAIFNVWDWKCESIDKYLVYTSAAHISNYGDFYESQSRCTYVQNTESFTSILHALRDGVRFSMNIVIKNKDGNDDDMMVAFHFLGRYSYSVSTRNDEITKARRNPVKKCSSSWRKSGQAIAVIAFCCVLFVVIRVAFGTAFRRNI